MTETPNERTNEPTEILDQDAVFADPDEVLDSGYSPPESYRGEGFGTTAEEQLEGETLDERLRQEEPEPDPYAVADEEVLDDGEVGAERAGRLVDPDGGIGEDTEKDLIGEDVGIDGAASSAEEAAVHVIED
ncbi:hypothetical protein GEV29_07055 [Aeromicrobium sp. SMF47]|uniref:Uncharacterized protein n=1 Tax=Aeromicrobium yanjiei TaxID=2662028 RepID=A0A5Q2MQF9_9ACTN|nr:MULTISPECIES: DUF5709 domain-containing protein [Aeromicrobium]MRJ76289.1 hypothetical protein [Aeromicrobium yanjiei]MRK00639.1 hypothetical protein [Aeromicrobium sp. S22]QGG42530.1 hypothetical protein GEV26_14730 [Aeromicrobium yanjiei]